MKNERKAYVITTSNRADADIIAKAASFSSKESIPFLEREGAIHRMQKEHGFVGAFIFAESEMVLWYQGEILRFHPNMAKHRILNLRRGGFDKMQQSMSLSAGDSILDCTLGLGTDAVVASFVVGQKGQVVALESELPIYLLVAEGLTSYFLPHMDFLQEPMRRIETHHQESYSFMIDVPDRSFDIVYFDPMFRVPARKSTGILDIRGMSNPAAVTSEHVREAMRISRRAVVLKERTGSGEFSSLGFTELSSARGSTVSYGVIQI
jgi:16S rRNA (guanine1516-N2)-methyltransferase